MEFINISKWSDDLYIFGYKHVSETEPVHFFHSHAGFEILFIHEGTGRCIIGDEIFNVCDNTLIVYRPYQLHSLYMDIPPTYVRTKLKVKESMLEQLKLLFPLHLEQFQQLWDGPYGVPVFYLNESQASQLDEMLLQLNRVIEQGHRAYVKETIIGFLQYFFSYVQRYLLKSRDVVERHLNIKNQHINNILAWVSRHYREEFRLEKMSENLHLTAGYLSSLFRQQTGRSLVEYITEMRLEHARTLLLNPDLPIKDICGQVGINSPSYLIQQFRKKYEITPNQYRRKLLKKGIVR